MDVYGIEQSAFGQAIWLNRLDTYHSGGSQFAHGTPQTPGAYHHAGNILQIAATNLQLGYSQIRFVVRSGEFLVNYIKLIGNRVAQAPSVYTNADNIYGDTSSLSDARLKSEVTPITGTQALDVLSQIKGCTYEREDLGQRRVGLIADEVESAIGQLSIDSVVSSKWHNDDQYKTLDYSRLVAVLIPAVNHLSKQIQSIINGSTSQSG